jgi:hypothetical protein
MDLQSLSGDFGYFIFFGACGIGSVCLLVAAVLRARPKPILIGRSGGRRHTHRHGIAPMPRGRSGSN